MNQLLSKSLAILNGFIALLIISGGTLVGSLAEGEFIDLARGLILWTCRAIQLYSWGIAEDSQKDGRHVPIKVETLRQWAAPPPLKKPVIYN